jgi:hypothetical protein
VISITMLQHPIIAAVLAEQRQADCAAKPTTGA